MEELIYKLKPYICLAVAMYAIWAGDLTPLSMFFTGTLLLCAWHIMSIRSKRVKAKMRKAHRRVSGRSLHKPKTYSID